MKKRKKRVTKLSVFLLAAVFMAIVMGGCSGKTTTVVNNSTNEEVAEDEDGYTVINMWTFYGDNPEERDMVDVFNEMADGYNETHGTKYKLVHTFVPWGDYTGTKMVTAFAAGIGPDVFYMSSAWLTKYYNAGNLYKLDDYMSEDVMKDIENSSEYCKNFQIGGNYYAIPMGMDLVGLFYDKRLFAANNMSVPTTFDELIDAAEKLSSDDRYGLTVRAKTQDAGYTPYTFYPFVWSAGGDIVDLAGKKSLLDSDGFYEALKLYQTLAEKNVINISPSRGEDDIGILCEGETAMQICGTWAISDVELYIKNGENVDIGVAPIPTLNKDIPSTTVAGGWGVSVNANSPVADEAAKLFTWAYLEETKYLEEILTNLNFAYPVRKSIQEKNEQYYHTGLRADFTDKILGSYHPELRLPTEALTPIADAIDSVLYGGSAEEAQKTAHEKLSNFLDSFIGEL